MHVEKFAKSSLITYSCNRRVSTEVRNAYLNLLYLREKNDLGNYSLCIFCLLFKTKHSHLSSSFVSCNETLVFSFIIKKLRGVMGHSLEV